MNPAYLILAAAAAIYFAPTLIGLVKMQMKIVSILPTAIYEQAIKLNVIFEYHNQSRFDIQLQKLNANVYLNGLYIGNIKQNYQIPVLAGRKQNASNTIEINPEILGAKLWQEILAMNLQNTVIQLKCEIMADNKTFKKNLTYTLQNIAK